MSPIGLVTRFASGLLVGLALLSGCGHDPATYGSHQRLSAAPDRVLVVGNQPSAVSTALTWLQSRGLLAVGTPMPWDLPGTEQLIVDQAHTIRAQVIVWVQQTGDLRAPMVSVRGIDVETQAVLWSGQARATTYRSTPAPHRIAWLTCHALHAAWGERASDDRQPGLAGDRCE
ncbi:hypothetical protein [Nitrospira moscoviensis]|jgi:hypothetical protein|uniref:Uncharacterized protein n=1 Tax=Nitrospira moscoviensis TaxID=42253 RepID=A0A0K2GDU3_NITMO|nr:hypothetical protein [Nitrospira moscoviensis]ALA59118.1 hypothetical protein NITMOv2_2707 [Nitrospira moscoviensis]